MAKIPRRNWPEWRWIRELKPGDVVEAPSGNLRIVRRVSNPSHNRQGRVSVYFVINHCSWTHRPYTVLCDSDLITMGYKPIGVRVTLDTDFDAQMQREIEKQSDPADMDCCDVKGIP